MNIDKNYLMNKILGVLYGVAIGDAMGMPTTFMSRDQIKAKYGKVTNFLEAPMEGSVHSKLVRGEYTDDTELTYMVADSIISRRQVDPEDMANRLVKWADDNDILNTTLIGPSTRSAIKNLKSGVPYSLTGKNGTTNGCAMKISPVGIFDAFSDGEKTVQDVINACLCTHNTALAISGAAAISFAVKKAVSVGQDTQAVYEASLEGADMGAQLMGDPAKSISLRIKEAIGIANSGNNFDSFLNNLYNFILKPQWALTEDSVPAAISIFLYSGGNFRNSILLACNLGADSDTIGGMVGAMAGSYAGFNNIPNEWVKTIDNSSKRDIRDLGGKFLDAMQL
ncbi:MAG: ADP-ribosylglycohydrolase family protein [Ferroplasma sp.]|uniref:ADP-ribosylglycohydrolase family protein n=1 Tax=Ferroplasma sp. TaxID=2591003 RepID=UPI002815B078|nr:ADP-ribosylglycohydrolase family protein [Ferroplasma sp.]WMT51562.1 MAG: ADP-ribosylglycohydrolase family protein [Ferroplasma sp.]